MYTHHAYCSHVHVYLTNYYIAILLPISIVAIVHEMHYQSVKMCVYLYTGIHKKHGINMVLNHCTYGDTE